MLGVSALLGGQVAPGDLLRYGPRPSALPAPLLHYAREKKPIVVWSLGRRCNLRCTHCYSDSQNIAYENELTCSEGLAVIDDLAAFGVPTILFSGGEPLLRPDLFELGRAAAEKKVRAVLSTNGTLIDAATARRIREAGFAYVGISLDGPEAYHDRFRGVRGAFQWALRGIKHCQAEGIRVGLRFTLHRGNVAYVGELFDLLEREEIPRLCVYHLAYAGRGSRLVGEDLSPQQTRATMDLLFQRTRDFLARGLQKEILTVDNHADNVYLWLRLRREEPARAEEVHQLLRFNGGNQSGIAVACLDSQGFVHPDQFWMHYRLGQVRERRFSEIWTDPSEPLLAGLKDRKKRLRGRCGKCPHLDICNGNLRVRAEAVYGDVWAEDPACYLSDEELGIR